MCLTSQRHGWTEHTNDSQRLGAEFVRTGFWYGLVVSLVTQCCYLRLFVCHTPDSCLTRMNSMSVDDDGGVIMATTASKRNKNHFESDDYGDDDDDDDEGQDNDHDHDDATADHGDDCDFGSDVVDGADDCRPE